MKRTIVVAKYQEDTSWTNKYSDAVVLTKGIDVHNIGREVGTYVDYIIENYDSLEGKYFFVQGNPYDHCPWIEEEFENLKGDFRWFSNRNFTCDLMGRPHDNVDIKKFLKENGLEYDKETIAFTGCCLFMVSAERIKRYPVEWYINLWNVLANDEKACYAFERCVGIIYGDE